MTKFLVYLFCLFHFMFVMGQTSMPIKYRFYFEETFKNYEERPIKKDIMILDVAMLDRNKTASGFYALNYKKRESVMDSIRTALIPHDEALRIIYNVPRVVDQLKTYKNFTKLGIIQTFDYMSAYFSIEESSKDMLNWRFLQGDTVILGFNCKYARASFRGRIWNVCYTLDIPIYEGPWKLHGLPGMILLAEDSAKDYKYECYLIEEPEDKILKLPGNIANYKPCSLEKYIKLQKMYAEDPDHFDKLIFGYKYLASTNGGPYTAVLREYFE